MSDHSSSYHKSLPRLPSASIDDLYDTSDDNEDGVPTPKGRTLPLPPHPPNTPLTPHVPPGSSVAFPFPPKTVQAESPTEVEAPAQSSDALVIPPTSRDSLQLLSNLRHSFQRTEQGLYTELANTQESCLNDVRRSFHTAAKGATRRLAAWQTKHSPRTNNIVELSPDIEPNWWSPECHAMPGSNVIVRDNDWGSIIAFTLRSVVRSQPTVLTLTCSLVPRILRVS